MRGLGFLLLLIGIGLMAYGATPLLTHHGSQGHTGSGAGGAAGCRLALADARNASLSFEKGYTWAIDVEVSDSPPAIISINAVKYSVGTHPMAASGLRVLVSVDGAVIYNGTASLGGDGLYHAVAAVPGSYVDGAAHQVHVELYACGGGTP